MEECKQLPENAAKQAVRQHLRQRFHDEPFLVNEWVVRAARLTRTAVFPRWETHYADLSIDAKVENTQHLLGIWMKTAAPSLDALRNAIYNVINGTCKVLEWPWTMDETYNVNGYVLKEFLRVVARVAHGLPPLE